MEGAEPLRNAAGALERDGLLDDFEDGELRFDLRDDSGGGGCDGQCPQRRGALVNSRTGPKGFILPVVKCRWRNDGKGERREFFPLVLSLALGPLVFRLLLADLMTPIAPQAIREPAVAGVSGDAFEG